MVVDVVSDFVLFGFQLVCREANPAVSACRCGRNGLHWERGAKARAGFCWAFQVLVTITTIGICSRAPAPMMPTYFRPFPHRERGAFRTVRGRTLTAHGVGAKRRLICFRTRYRNGVQRRNGIDRFRQAFTSGVPLACKGRLFSGHTLGAAVA